MSCVQSRQSVDDDGQDQIGRPSREPSHQLLEATPFDVVHHQVRLPTVKPRVIDCDDIGMVKLAGNASFFQEVSGSLCITAQVISE